jgi:hypothetical protein
LAVGFEGVFMGDLGWLDDVLDDDEDGDGGQGKGEKAMEGPKALRAAYKAKDKRVKELEAQVAELSNKARRVDVQTVLSGLGVKNPKIARLIPDSVEATEEAVTKWVEDFRDVLGLEPATPPEDSKQSDGKTDGEPAGTPVSQSYVDGVKRTTKIGSDGANTPPAAHGSDEDFLAGLKKSGASFDEIAEAFRNHKQIP